MTCRHLLFLLPLVGVSLVLQSFFFGAGLTNDILSSTSLTSTDALDYTGLAQGIAEGRSFSTMFGDGYRLPAYPLFVAIFINFFSEPFLIVRKVQVILCALLPVVAFATLPLRAGAIAAVLTAVWLPFHYFSTLLLAESCSLFLLSLFLFALIRRGEPLTTVRVITASCVLGLLVLLKPNHLFLALALVVVINKHPRVFSSKVVAFGLAAAILAIWVLPWSVFVSFNTGRFVPLSTTQGINLYLGLAPAVVQELAPELHDRPTQSPAAVADWSRQLQHRAIEHMAANPIQSLSHGFSKVRHAFGFSFRSMHDCCFAVVGIVTLLGSVALWRLRVYREVCLVVWCCLLAVVVQAGLFLPNQRFKIMLFDYPAILLCGCLGGLLWSRHDPNDKI